MGRSGASHGVEGMLRHGWGERTGAARGNGG